MFTAPATIGFAVLISISCRPVAPPDRIEPSNAPATRTPRTVLPFEKDVGPSELLHDSDKRLQAIGIEPLSNLHLRKDEMEVRVWKGWGMRGASGAFFKKGADGWTANLITLPAGSRSIVRALPAPRSGWEAFWSELNANRILDLPDDSEVGEVDPFEDSEMVIVDLLVDNRRQTYSYNAPCYSEVEAGRNVKRIGEIIAKEFELPRFGCD